MNLNNNEKMAILTVVADAICTHMENETLKSAYQKIYDEWNKEIDATSAVINATDQGQGSCPDEDTGCILHPGEEDDE